MTYNEQLKLIKEQANINNEWSAKQAQKQMDYQTKMSNTAHQREMADLKAAGLNPVLAANSGASTPSGAMGSTDESSTGAIAGLLQEMMVQESANARAAIKAATAAANANAYASRTSFKSLQNEEENLLWQFLLELTGNGDKTNKEIAKDAATNLSILWNKAKSAVSSGVTAAVRSVSSGDFTKNFAKGLKTAQNSYGIEDIKALAQQSAKGKVYTTTEKAGKKFNSRVKY